MVLDVTMPELNGLDATRQIRRAVSSGDMLASVSHVMLVGRLGRAIRHVVTRGQQVLLPPGERGLLLLGALHHGAGSRERSSVTPLQSGS